MNKSELPQAILALDVGTSSVKAAALDQRTGEPLAEPVHVKYTLHFPEQDAAVIEPEELWLAVCDASRAAGRGQTIVGLGFSVFSPGLLLADELGKPLTPIITHLDRRARPLARKFRAEWGADFLNRNGNPILPGGISAITARLLLDREPQLQSRVRHFWHLNSWLGWKFTGQAAMDPGNAAFTGLCAAMEGFTWSPWLADKFGIPLTWLPEIQDGRVSIGNLLPELARTLGLPSGIPVKLGVADTSSAALAVNLQLGELLHVVGTTQVLAALTATPKPGAMRLTRPLGAGSTFLQVTHNPVGGVALDWIHNLCFRDQSWEEFFRTSLRDALTRSTAVKLDPLFLGGDRLEIDARTASFQGLSLQTNRQDLLAALLAAMRTGHRLAYDHLELPAPPTRVVLSGGGAEVVRALLPEYAQANIHITSQASLRGVARLFD